MLEMSRRWLDQLVTTQCTIAGCSSLRPSIDRHVASAYELGHTQR